jgi:protein TonB
VDYVLDVQVGPPPPFDEDRMSGPTKLSGPDPEYTPEAMDRQVEGTMEVRCIVTAVGRAHSCQVLKALPFMSRPVVEALERRTYSPARLNGQALDVQYTFRINLRLPE